MSTSTVTKKTNTDIPASILAMAQVTSTLENLNPAKITLSANNPRKNYDKAAFEELVASVRVSGVIQPIIVCPLAKNGGTHTHELIAGERRLTAAQKAKLTSIPCIVRGYNEEQVRAAQTIENSHREDVHPLQEADGYKASIDVFGYTPETLAAQYGRPVDYIYKRIALLTIIKPVREAFLGGSINIGHTTEFARLPQLSQKALFEMMWKPSSNNERQACSVRELKEMIRKRIMLNLLAAPWNRDDAELLPAAGACSACPKRTGANRNLFNEMEAGSDECLDQSCYEEKLDARLVQIQTERQVTRVSDFYNGAEGILGRRDYVEIEEGKKACSAATDGLLMDGANIAKTIRICIDRSCKKHYPEGEEGSPSPAAGTGRGSTALGSTPKSKWDEKAERLKEKIENEVQHRVMGAICEAASGLAIYHQQLQAMCRLLLPYHTVPVGLIDILEPVGVPLGEKMTGNEARNALSEIIEAPKGSAKAKELPGVLMGLMLKEFVNLRDVDKKLPAVAAAFGVDYTEVQKSTTKELQDEFNEKRAKAEGKATSDVPKKKAEPTTKQKGSKAKAATKASKRPKPVAKKKAPAAKKK